MAEILPPDACRTMTDVRAGVDQVDRELIALLARRFGYLDAAARIKPSRDRVRDEDRKRQVIDNASPARSRPGFRKRRSQTSGSGWSRPRSPTS
jgi:isochorismate pyruvate lyase